MGLLCCPLRYSNLIALSSYKATQLSPTASTISGQSLEQPAQITQVTINGETQLKNQTVTLPRIIQSLREFIVNTKARLDIVSPLDYAGNLPESSLLAN